MKKFEVPNIYRSEILTEIKENRRVNDRLKKDFEPTILDYGAVKIYLARHFGFCYGVENAIEIAFKTISENPGKRIFLLSEMIHNPMVNKDLEDNGVRFLQDTVGNQLIPFDSLNADDIVIIPAFGTTLQVESNLKLLGIETKKYNTTCPFVEKVWNRSEQIASRGYSIVVHGKPKHEETRATFSHASSHTPTLVIKDMAEAILLSKIIKKELPATDFFQIFKGRYSDGFDPNKDLSKIGVVNQTTQLASDTQAISDYLKETIVDTFQLAGDAIKMHFADTRDTLCYATNDNQSAVAEMLKVDADFAVIVGGYNSSNTSHLVEMCESKMPSYFINGADKLLSKQIISHCHWQKKEEVISQNYWPEKKVVKILLTSGASCPDSIVESVLNKLISFR